MIRKLWVIGALLGCGHASEEAAQLRQQSLDRVRFEVRVLRDLGFRAADGIQLPGVPDSTLRLRLFQTCQDGGRQMLSATFEDSAGMWRSRFTLLDTALAYHSGLTFDQLFSAQATCAYGDIERKVR